MSEEPKGMYVWTSLARVRTASLTPGVLTLIGMVDRPGVMRLLWMIEEALFPPGTEMNDLFQLTLAKWPEEKDGLRWWVALLPEPARAAVDRLADEVNMRIADGVPTIVSSEGVVSFPIAHARVFTIENDLNSPIYLPGGPGFTRDEERRWLTAAAARVDAARRRKEE
jgi:hypothetical protein